MSDIYIDPIERKKIATRWVNITLVALHLWASCLVAAVLLNRHEAQVIAAMFSTVTFGIGATLAILLLDKASDVLLSRFALPSAPPAAMTETVTRTVTPGAPAPDAGAAPADTTAKDVNIHAEGAVNVTSNP